MCLVAVYLQQEDGTLCPEPRFEDVAKIECRQGQIVIGDMFDRREVLRGRVRSIDLLRNKVVIETLEGQERAGP